MSNKANFYKDLSDFVIQAATGAVMAYIKFRSIPSDMNAQLPPPTDLLSYLSKIYLNGCWHSYGKKNDPYVITSFDRILSHNIIKGKFCLVHWIDGLCSTVFRMEVLQRALKEWNTLEESIRREKFFSLITQIVNKYIDTVKDQIICIGNDCKDVYDGTDFFSFDIGVNNDKN